MGRRKGRGRRTSRLWAVVRGAARSLALSAVALAPGAVLLASGQTLVGYAWLLVASFLLLLRTYAREWRLSKPGILIAPLTAVLCVIVQAALFDRALPSVPILVGAVVVGLLLGSVRARTHGVFVRDGAVFAQRSVLYLGAWAVFYAVTQVFAHAGRVNPVRYGLAGGVLSAAALVALAWHLWQRLDRERGRLRRGVAASLVVVVGAGVLLLAAHETRAEDPPGPGAVLDAILGSEPLPILGAQSSRAWEREETPGSGASRSFVVDFGVGRRFPRGPPDRRGVQQEAVDLAQVVVVHLRRFDSASECAREGRLALGLARRGRSVSRGMRAGRRFADVTPLETGQGGVAAKGQARDFRGMGRGGNSGSWWSFNRWHRDHGGAESATVVAEARIYDGRWRIVVDVPLSFRRPHVTVTAAGGSKWDADAAQDQAEIVARFLHRRLPAAVGAAGGDWSSESGGIAAVAAGLLGPYLAELPERAREAAAVVVLILVLAGVGAQLAQVLATEMISSLDGGGVGPPARRAPRADPGPKRRPPRRTAAPVEEPPPVDPRTGRPLLRGKGGRFHDPDTGALLTREQAEGRAAQIRHEQRLEEREARAAERRAAEQREQERRRFEQETRARRDELTRRARVEDDALRREIAEREQAREDLEQIERAAVRMGDTDLLLRSGVDRIFREDGSLDTEYVAKLKRILRDRLAREAAAPDEALEESWGGWIVEGAAKTVEDASKSLVVRLGTGVLSGGSSEVFWQSWAAGRSMREAAELAADEGREMGFGEAFGRGLKDLGEQNAPIATAQAIGRWRKGEEVSWTELGVSVVGDVLGTFGLISDMRSVAGGLGRSMDTLRSGARHGFTPGTARELWQNVRYEPSTGVLSAFARNTLDPDSFRHLSDVARGAKQDLASQVRSALRKIGVQAETPSWRLSPDEAQARMNDTRLSDDIARRLDEVQRGASDDLRELDEAFLQGRAGGRQRIAGLQESLGELDSVKKAGGSADEVARAERAVRDDVLRVQADKHAMNEMNLLPKTGGENETVRAFNQEMGNIYQDSTIRTKERLAEMYGVRPEDIQEVEITNLKGEAQKIDPGAPARDHMGLASKKVEGGGVEGKHGVAATHGPAARPAGPAPAHGRKVSFDRDLTMRVRTIENGREVWRDIPSWTLGKVYNEELAKVALGRTDILRSRGVGFENVHLRPDDHLTDVVRILDADKLAQRLDQATTDRLHPEAYGVGQADLDAATKDAFRGRDLTDVGAVSKTVEFKVHHWMNEADRLAEAAMRTDDAAARMDLLGRSAALREEGMRQLTKQYQNMVITRTGNMLDLRNATGASIPGPLAERLAVLKGMQDGHYSPAMAEAILRGMGTDPKQVAHQMSAYVEGLQKLRPAVSVPVHLPRIRLRRDDE